jgi:hypothetical protein
MTASFLFYEEMIHIRNCGTARGPLPTPAK